MQDAPTTPSFQARLAPEVRPIDIDERFTLTLVPEVSWLGPDLLPTALARAAAHVLSVAAADIVVVDGEHRIPIGASSTDAVAAERWQFTTDEGPWSDLGRLRAPLVVTETALQWLWPALHRALRSHTSFASMVVLPLGRGTSGLGAVTLYLQESSPGPGFTAHAAAEVAALVHAHLVEDADRHPPSIDLVEDDEAFTALMHELGRTASPAAPGPPSGVRWLQTPIARQRQQVWVAVGMCVGSRGVDTDHALALLRAHALRRDTTLDVLAHDITSGRTSVDEIDT